MPQLPATQGAIMTMFFNCYRQRFQCAIPYVATNPINTQQAYDDLSSRALVLALVWMDVLAADCKYTGCNIVGMEKGTVRPKRQEAVPPLEGNVVGDSYSPNASMQLAFYSYEAVGAWPRLRVGKQFIGPPPESKCEGDVLDNAFALGAVNALAQAIMGPFVGGSGAQWTRAVEAMRGNPGTDFVWTANVAVPRTNIVTQRRRVRPIL